MENNRSYDIRSILEEMRQEYWQGLAEKAELQEEVIECLTFMLGGELYAFETTDAAEVLRLPKLVKVPGVPEFITGIFNLRGEIIAAMDIRPILGIVAPALTESARIIVIKGSSYTTGIIVESVNGVHPLQLDLFEPVVKSVPAASREFLRGQINSDGQMTILLDITRLLATPELTVEQL